jgi:acyl carrier protein
MSTLSATLLDFVRTRAAAEGAAAEITESTPLLSRGVIDSLGLTQLIALIRRETGVVVPDEEISPANFETVGAIARLVERLNRGGGSRG